MQWNRRQDFCTPFSSGHIPANIPCPVLGDPVDSSPGLLPVLGWAEAEAEWEAAKAAPQDIQSELALSKQSLLGGRRKRHWVSTALCGPWQPPLNPAAIVQTSVWTSGIRVLTGVSKTLLSTGSPLWQSHSSIQTPPQGSSNYITHKGCQSVVSPLMEQPTHICRHSGRLPQEALCYPCFPLLHHQVQRGCPNLQPKQDHSQHGVEEAESPLCCWWWSHTGTTVGNRVSLTTCCEILWINGMCFSRWLQYVRSWLTD